MNMFTNSLSTPGVTLSAITSVVAPLSTSLSAVVEVVVSKSLSLCIVMTLASCVAMFLLWKMLLLCSLSFDFVTGLITNPSYLFSIHRSRSQSSTLLSTPSDSPQELGFTFSWTSPSSSLRRLPSPEVTSPSTPSSLQSSRPRHPHRFVH